MSWLTRIALHNRSIVGLTVVAVALAGVFAVTSLKQELIPDLKFPYLTVFTVAPGSSPTGVAREVTTPLEQAIKTTSGVKEYDSYSNDGVSIITVEYEFGTDMSEKENEVQQAITGVQAILPPNAAPPSVAALNFGSLPVVQLAVSSPMPPDELAALLGTRVVPRLQEIDGVQAVTLSGVAEDQLQIELRPEAVQRLGITPQQIMTALQEANVTTGAGNVTAGSLVYHITVDAAAETIADLERIVVAPASADGPVTLADVAKVRIAPKPLTAITRTNGEPSVGISVSKAASGNTVEIADGVIAALPAIAKDLGGQATITTVLDQSVFIKDSISSLWREGLLGAVFAVLVIFVFLRSWRSTLIAGLSIPLSVLGALILLWSQGESLNMMTLGGLTIAIGRVIDDSIVVIENVHRHLQEGDEVRSAAFGATREVAGAITASTLTTVAVFLPLGFVHGLASEFFRPFAYTVTFALLASLLVALTVVPVVATLVLSKRQVGHRDPTERTLLQRGYLPILERALDHKAVTVIAAVAIFVATMSLGPLLKTNLFDHSAENSMTVTQVMPPGSSLKTTAAAARHVEEVLADLPGVETYQVTMGSTGSLFGAGGGTSASSSQAVFTVLTDPDMDKLAIVASAREELADLDGLGTVTVTGEDSSMGTSALEVQVSAEDEQVLKDANETVLTRMLAVEGLADVTSNLSEGRPSVVIKVDQRKAALAGVSPTTLSQYTTLLLDGYPLGTVPTEKGPLSAALVVEEFVLPPLPGVATVLANVPVPTASGMVPLGDIAEVVEVRTPVQVTHVDGTRTATISAAVVNNNIGAASTAVEDALADVSLPAGASWRLAGATAMTNDVFRTLGIAMAIAILLVYIIMVGTFRSLLNPLILLVSIPFAAVGAVVLLLVSGTSLGMPSMVGLLMLIGIVVTNAIVLLDLVEQFRRRGMSAREAVIEGSRRRLRPILMTAIATILALLPMSLGLGEGAFLSTPLSVVVIGGLFTSTALTLVLVPVLYLALARLRKATPPAPEADGLA